MKRSRRGFTLIEVSLFLAISGLLLVGVIAGTQSSIVSQRFKDSVQNYVEFLRSVYSEVNNPQSPADGRSDYVIYGRLVSFGQNVSLTGERIPEYEQRIYVYDVVGSSANVGTGAAADTLKALNANVVIENKDESGKNIVGVNFAGNVKEYIPTWGAAIDTTKNGELFTGSILIVRHPRSGTISTLISSPSVIQINKIVTEANQTKDFSKVKTILTDSLNTFKTQEVDFCVNPNGVGFKADVRRNVRLLENTRNASGIELINQDDDENRCLK